MRLASGTRGLQQLLYLAKGMLHRAFIADEVQAMDLNQRRASGVRVRPQRIEVVGFGAQDFLAAALRPRQVARPVTSSGTAHQLRQGGR